MTAESELAAFIAKFAPEMQARIRGCRARLLTRFPNAVQLAYDNYNFMVIGFGPTSRPSDAIFSLAAQRRGVNLCFLQRGAAALPLAAVPMETSDGVAVIIKSVSAKQRPRQ